MMDEDKGIPEWLRHQAPPWAVPGVRDLDLDVIGGLVAERDAARARVAELEAERDAYTSAALDAARAAVARAEGRP
jgi:hypothetical protein